LDQDVKKFKTLDIIIFLLIVAVIAAFIAPRYHRYAKIGQAKSLIVQLEEAAMTVIREVQAKKAEAKETGSDFSDEQYLDILKEQMHGHIPVNPFTNNEEISLMHQHSFSPGDILDVKGGWIWKLVVPEEGNQSSSASSG